MNRYNISVSLWYNHGEPNPLAVPEAPDLGETPHAQEVMRHYGITYREAIPRTISDSWQFLGCDKHPTPIPRWMHVSEETSEQAARSEARIAKSREEHEERFRRANDWPESLRLPGDPE